MDQKNISDKEILEVRTKLLFLTESVKKIESDSRNHPMTKKRLKTYKKIKELLDQANRTEYEEGHRYLISSLYDSIYRSVSKIKRTRRSKGENDQYVETILNRIISHIEDLEQLFDYSFSLTKPRVTKNIKEMILTISKFGEPDTNIKNFLGVILNLKSIRGMDKLVKKFNADYYPMADVYKNIPSDISIENKFDDLLEELRKKNNSKTT